MVIDLRSDTVTKPSKGMLEAMFNAPVGDDVFKEDPTVNRLEQLAADMFGMEAGIFCPSGTMTNQIAIKLHTKPGDEVICHKECHVYKYEGGGIAVNSQSSVRLITGNEGRFNAQAILDNINNPEDVHLPLTSLVCAENTSNRGGGVCYDINDLKEMAAVCKANGLKFHLDGARIFNALVAKNEDAKEYGKMFDTISICLSKGLGTPIGSVLLGSKKDVYNARRIRKVLGGGMRQVGYIAAAGIYALEHNIDRLQEDHDMAQQIKEALSSVNYVEQILPVETNIVVFDLKDNYNADSFLEYLKNNNVLGIKFGPNRVRLTFHLDITKEMLQRTIELLKVYKG